MDLSTILDAIVKTSEQLQIKSNQTFSLDRTLGSLASITLTLGLYRILKSMKGKISNSGVVDLVKICLTSLLMGDVNDAQRRLKGRDIDFSASADSVFEDDSNGGGYVKRLTGSCHCRSVSFVVSVSFLFKKLVEPPILISWILLLIVAFIFHPTNRTKSNSKPNLHSSNREEK